MVEQIEGFHLSTEQRYLWKALQEKKPSYLSGLVQVPENISSDKLKQAIIDVAKNHEILRTCFRALPGMAFPLQVVKDEACVCFYETSENLINAEVTEECSLLDGSYHVPEFNFDHGPLIYCELKHNLDGAMLLYLAIPTLNIDTFSFKDLVTEISKACKTDSPQITKEEVTQFIDFSEWQNESLGDPETQEYNNAWRRYHEDQWQELYLPNENKDLQESLYDKKFESGQIKGELALALEKLSIDLNVSLSTLLQAAFHLLLWRLTGEDNIVTYRLVDGRTFPEIENAIGPYSKLLPVRTSINGNRLFSELAEKLSDSIQELTQVQFLNAYDISKFDTQEVRKIGFCFDIWPDIYADDSEELTLIDLHNKNNVFKLKLDCLWRDSILSWRLDYCSGSYTQSDAEFIVTHFLALLADVVESKQKPIGALNYLPDHERNAMLTFKHAQDANEMSCLHELFSKQAAQTPDALALVDQVGTLTFRDVEQKSNQLARHLRTLGANPESRLGLCTSRHCDMIVSLLAILKSGAAYVPLDPDFPKDRINKLIQSANVLCVITEESLLHKIPSECTSLCIDSISLLDDISTEPLKNKTKLDNLAYVLYTSGTTGNPKGVEITHRSLLNLLDALNERIYDSLAKDVIVGLNAAITFDASVKQILQLCSGHTLVIIPEEIRLDAKRMWDFLNQHSVNVFDCTPIQWKLLIAEGMPQKIPSPFCVLLGGEAIDSDMWRQLLALQQKQTNLYFYNLYGPTETTVDVAAAPVILESPVSVGRPLANVQAYVLNDYLQPVAKNVIGELYIGGSGVARGYLGQAIATASKFIPDPFSDEAGARLYQSGDLARWNSGGDLEIVGRADDQIKIRGVRIEPGEIESIMRSLPGIKQSVVIAREDHVGDVRLAAYFIPDRANSKTIDKIPRYSLPNGMSVVHKKPHETDYVFDEIFTQLSYVQHGIRLPKNGCIVDVGANIGLFTLFAGLYCPDSTVYSFEPIPELFQLLRLNTELYSKNNKLLPIGLSDKQRTETFTYYSGYTVMSGQSSYADADSEVDVIKRFLSNQEQQGDSDASTLLENVGEILNDKFQSESVSVSLHRLSDILQEQGIDTIDLLKIDVQRAEWDVLCGINDEDWPRIKQIVMEVHSTETGDTKHMIHRVSSLLKSQDYTVVTEQHALLQGTDRYNVYAWREGCSGMSVDELQAETAVLENSRVLTEQSVRDFLRKQLPDYLVPTDYILMSEFPLNRSGKIDRQALPQPEQLAREDDQFIAPSEGIQATIASVWKEILNLRKVSVKDNFFDIGGHSITLVQVHTVLSQKIDKSISILDLFQHPTIESLTEFLSSDDSTADQSLQRIEERAKTMRQRRSNMRKQVADI